MSNKIQQDQPLNHLTSAGLITDLSLASHDPQELIRSKTASDSLQIRARESKASSDEGRILTYVASDETPDRVGDVIQVNGWELTQYKQNPVILWGHDGNAIPPIGRATNVRRGQYQKKKALLASIEFAPAEAHPFAETVYQLAKGGFVNAVSVGFMPLETKEIDDKERKKLGMPQYGVMYSKASLLEVSLVSVPANPSALEVGAKGLVSKGLLTTKEVDRFLKEVPLTEAQVADALKARVRSFVDFGALGSKAPEEQKSPACRTDGESKAECVARKIPELMEEEGMEQDQAVAVAESVCETPCSEGKESSEGLSLTKEQKLGLQDLAKSCEAFAALLRASSGKMDEEDEEDEEGSSPYKAADETITRLIDAQAEQARALTSLVDSISDLTSNLRRTSGPDSGVERGIASVPDAVVPDAGITADQAKSVQDITADFMTRINSIK